MTKICLCIATYKRPALLTRLIESIAESVGTNTARRAYALHTVIVDNDSRLSAQHTVLNLKDLYPALRIGYYSQDKQNIALTRNLAVMKAGDVDFLLFVDDDEWVGRNWIDHLLDAARTHQADVVFSRVNKILPDGCPHWISQSNFFAGRHLTEGSLVEHGATNNTLVRASALMSMECWFNPEFGLTGGSDTELFYRMHLAGYKLIWTNRAPVSEEIPLERANARWIIKRAFRAGQCFSRIMDARKPQPLRALLKLRSACILVAALMLIIISAPFNRARCIRFCAYFASNLGRITAMRNLLYSEYRQASSDPS